MRHLTNQSLTIDAPNQIVYLQDRMNISVTDLSATEVSVIFGGETIATYILDNAHKVTIDLTDLIRVYRDNPEVTIKSNAEGEPTIVVGFVIGGLLNPAHTYVPSSGVMVGELPFDIIAPRMMYGGMDANLMIEFYAPTDDLYVDGEYLEITEINTHTRRADDMSPMEVISSGSPKYIIVHGKRYDFTNERTDVGWGWQWRTELLYTKSRSPKVGDQLYDPDGSEHRDEDQIDEVYGTDTTLLKVTPRPMVCGHDYILVRWESAFGTTKQAIWEVRNHDTSVGESVNLVSIDGGYNRLKGRVDGLDLVLDNLTSYDLWYYSDIITSSSVEVLMNADGRFGDDAEWFKVDVQTKSVKYPNGDAGEMNELKVNIKVRDYDAVTM